MPSALANENLCIKGYPAHKCLLPGEYHNINSKSKGIGGLTQKEVLILVEALKAGTMYVAKVPKTSRGMFKVIGAATTLSLIQYFSRAHRIRNPRNHWRSTSFRLLSIWCKTDVCQPSYRL